MLLSCKSARSKYVQALEEVKKSKKSNETSKKRKLIEDEIVNIKRKKMNVELCVKSLNKDMNEYCDRAAKSQDLSLFLQVNDLRKAVVNKESTISSLENAIKKLEDELKMK